jgi:hypothetical protein
LFTFRAKHHFHRHAPPAPISPASIAISKSRSV